MSAQTSMDNRPFNHSLVVSFIEEFYSTTDEAKRQQLDKQLCILKSSLPCEQTITECILLMDNGNSSSVRYFGSVLLYDTVRQRSEECIGYPNLINGLKTFLIENLSSSAHAQMQSITNKLSATFALLILYSIPDVWPDPVQDLTIIWSNSPELLLRVLAELAAEFCHVQMPLAQRSLLKTELHRISEEIILIISTVMGAADATPSTRQAAVECVEQWLQLPGIRLDNWTNVLSIVFAAVSEDNAALTNLLNILATNEDLSVLQQLVLDVCNYITRVAAGRIATELQADCDSDEVVSLVSAVCCLSERSIPTLIKFAERDNMCPLVDICQLFVTLSSWPGHFPVDETISDLPAVFWTTLREDLLASRSHSLNNQTSAVILAVQDMFAAVCSAAIEKLSFLPDAQFEQLDKEQRDSFLTYRRNCSDVPVNAFYIVGDNTLNFFNSELKSAIENGNLRRLECIVHFWELVADHLSEEQYQPICTCLNLCSRINDVPVGCEGDRLAGSILRMLFALSHLIQDHENSVELETHCVKMVLSLMDRPLVIVEALRTLEKFVELRSDCLWVVGDSISEKCYNLFMDSSNSQKVRLLSLKCVAFVLSMKSDDTVMNVLNRLIAPHVSSLSIDEGSVIPADEVDIRIFQIRIFSCLFTSLHNDKKASTAAAGETPIVSMFRQAVPVFERLLKTQGEALAIGDKVCEAIRSVVISLKEPDLDALFSIIAEMINQTLLVNTPASCALAKSTVLAYSRFKSSETKTSLCCAISKWFEMIAQNSSHRDIDEFLGLMYHVLKKDWKVIRTFGAEASHASIACAIQVAESVLMTSNEPCVVRLASQVLGAIASQTISFSDEQSRSLLAASGSSLVKIVFLRIQSEVARNTVESLSDVLFFFTKYFPMETREILSKEAWGDSPLLAAMFKEVGNVRNFKQMAVRLNQACRKS